MLLFLIMCKKSEKVALIFLKSQEVITALKVPNAVLYLQPKKPQCNKTKQRNIPPHPPHPRICTEEKHKEHREELLKWESIYLEISLNKNRNLHDTILCWNIQFLSSCPPLKLTWTNVYWCTLTNDHAWTVIKKTII